MMKIVLVCSAEPDFHWEKQYTPAEYQRAMEQWNKLPVQTDGPRFPGVEGYTMWSGTSLHASQTAELWVKQRGDRGLICEKTPLLDDIPLLPFADDDRAFLLKRFLREGKRQWRQGDVRQPESRAISVEKANRLVDELERRCEDTILISYERRILVILEVLHQRRYQIRRGSLFHLSPLERVLAAKEILTCGSCAHNCQLDHPGCDIGRDKANQRRKKESPIFSFFDDAIFSCDVGLLKPDPEIYELSLSTLGVSPEDAVFVGDGGSSELAGARALGMRTVCTEFLRIHDENERRVIHQSADWVVRRFDVLKDFLRKEIDPGG